MLRQRKDSELVPYGLIEFIIQAGKTLGISRIKSGLLILQICYHNFQFNQFKQPENNL
jgi:hypothetical protein